MPPRIRRGLSRNGRRRCGSCAGAGPLVRVDGVASVVAPEDGKYIVQVRERAYAGNGACLYRLHIGHFPRPRAIVPAGGKLGEKVAVKWIGDVTGDKTTEVTLPAAPDRNFGLVAQDENGVAPHPNAFRLSPFGNAVEVEPNDDHATATPFTAPLALGGVIEKAAPPVHAGRIGPADTPHPDQTAAAPTLQYGLVPGADASPEIKQLVKP